MERHLCCKLKRITNIPDQTTVAWQSANPSSGEVFRFVIREQSTFFCRKLAFTALIRSWLVFSQASSRHCIHLLVTKVALISVHQLIALLTCNRSSITCQTYIALDSPTKLSLFLDYFSLGGGKPKCTYNFAFYNLFVVAKRAVEYRGTLWPVFWRWFLSWFLRPINWRRRPTKKYEIKIWSINHRKHQLSLNLSSLFFSSLLYNMTT